MRSVSNALTLIEQLARQQPVGVSSLARSLDLPKTSVLRSLRTLEAAGWATVMATSSRWVLTEKVLQVGLAASPGLPGLREIVSEEMSRLRDRYGETVHLGVRDGDSLVVVNRLDGTRAIRTFLQLGARTPLELTASGLAILAALPDAELNGVLDVKRTGDPARLHAELKVIREVGYAVNRGLWRPDIGAIAAAIVGPSGRLVGALAVVMPLNRVDEVEQDGAGADLMRTCRALRSAAIDDL